MDVLVILLTCCYFGVVAVNAQNCHEHNETEYCVVDDLQFSFTQARTHCKDVLLADELIMIKTEDVRNFMAEIIFSYTG